MYKKICYNSAIFLILGAIVLSLLQGKKITYRDDIRQINIEVSAQDAEIVSAVVGLTAALVGVSIPKD
jgi:hypothetical protein